MKQINYIFLLMIFILWGCNNPEPSLTVDFADTLKTDNAETELSKQKLYVAIASITSPKETHAYYGELLNYIAHKLGRPIAIKQKKTYEEINELIIEKQVGFAFISPNAYLDLKAQGKIKSVAMPIIFGKPSYQAYIIVNKSSNIRNFEELNGKSFAFTDPMSLSGYLFPAYKVQLLPQSTNFQFNKTLFTYGHDISIQMVNRNIIDGASVHGLIFEYLSTEHPDRVENIRIIERSPNFGMSPVVSPADMNDKCFLKIQGIFLNLHNDSIGRSILEKLHIDKFVAVNDTIFENVNKLKQLTNHESD